jgi:hypothetical protein
MLHYIVFVIQDFLIHSIQCAVVLSFQYQIGMGQIRMSQIFFKDHKK